MRLIGKSFAIALLLGAATAYAQSDPFQSNVGPAAPQSMARPKPAQRSARPAPEPPAAAARTSSPSIRHVVSFTVPDYPKPGMRDMWANTAGTAWVERPTAGPVNNFRSVERITVDECPGARLVSDRPEGHVEAFVPDVGCSNMTLRLKVYVAGGNPYWSSFGGTMQEIVTAGGR